MAIDVYQGDTYNDITKSPIYKNLYDKMDYVLTQESTSERTTGPYILKKKPVDEKLVSVSNPYIYDKFINKGFKVMIIHVDRTFDIFNLTI